MKKTVLFLLLALVLCLALIPQDAHAAENYYIWIGDTQIDSDNATDVFEDGTVSYDRSTRTLTLNNFNYTGQGWKNYNSYYGIYIGDSGDITIQLIGQNSVKLAASEANNSSYGLYYSNYDSITFKGSGSLELRGGDIDGSSYDYTSGGLGASYGPMIFGNEFTGSIDACGGEITNSGTSVGIYAYSGFSIYNGAISGRGGGHSGAGSCRSYGVLYSSTSNVFGGSVSALGGDLESTDSYALSWGLYSYYSSYNMNVFAGTLVASGGTAEASSEANSYGMNSGYFNAYGGISILQGGPASKTDLSSFASVYSKGAVSRILADGGAVIARAGTVNGGYRMALYDYYYYTNRSASGQLMLGSGSVLAKAVGWEDPTGASGFTEFTVTTDHTTATNIGGTAGSVSNYREGLGYKYDVTPWPSGIVIVPSDWTEIDALNGALAADSYIVNLEASSPSADSIELGEHTLFSINMLESLTEGVSFSGLEVSSGISGSGGTLVAVGPTLTGEGSASIGLTSDGTPVISGNVSAVAAGGSAPESLGVKASGGSMNAGGITGDGQFIAVGITDANGETAINTGALSISDQGKYFRAADYGLAAPVYTVTVNPGAHMTKTEASGDLVQTGSAAITDIVITADEGYYFPEDYTDTISVKESRSLSVYRNSASQITISGIPSINQTFDLPDATLYEYPVWIGGVRVTGINKNDLVSAINEAAGETVATGTAVYTPDSRIKPTNYVGTLTLTDFNYTGPGYEFDTNKYAALYVHSGSITFPGFYQDFTLTVNISGDNRFTQHVDSASDYTDEVYSIYVYGGGNRDQGINFAGSGTLTATADAAGSKSIAAGLFVYGHCYATNGADLTFIAPSGDITVSSGIILYSNTYYLGASGGGRMLAVGDTYAVQDKTTGTGYSLLQYSDPYCILAGTAYDGSDAAAYAGTGNDKAKDLEGYKYILLDTTDIFVAGVPIAGTTEDVTTVVNTLFPGSMTGTASYDADTHALTLTDVELTTISTGTTFSAFNGISYYGAEDLNIVVNGTNRITSRERSGDDTCGIFSQKGINLTGEGKLTVQGGDVTSYASTYGIDTWYTLTVDGPEVEVYAGNAAQYDATGVEGNVCMKSGILRAFGGKSNNDCADGIDGTVLVEGGRLEATAGTYYDDSPAIDGSLTLNDGEVIVMGGTSTYSTGGTRGIDSSVEVNGGALTVTTPDCGGYNYALYSSLTVNDGTVNITTGNAGDLCYGIDSTLTVKGGTVNITTGSARYSYGTYNLNMYGGTLKLVAGDATDASYAVYYYTNIYGGSAELISTGTGTEAQATRYSINLGEDAMIITASPNPDGSDPVDEYNSSDFAQYKYIKTGAAYKLWVGGVRAGENNYTDILGDGTVSYDPETAELTVSNRTIDHSDDGDYNEKAVIHYTDTETPLTINIVGNVSLNKTSQYRYNYYSGIYSTAALTIKLADGAVLNVAGAGVYSDGNYAYYGIFAQESLTIDGAGTANIKAPDINEGYGQSTGLCSWENIAITGGATVNVQGGDAIGYTSNYYGTRYSSRSYGIYIPSGYSLMIGDGCTVNAVGGSASRGDDSGYSYRGDSVGLFVAYTASISISGRASATFTGGSVNKNTGSYGDSCGALFYTGYSNSTVTVNAADWSGSATFTGNDYGMAQYSNSGYGTNIVRNPEDCEMTGYAEILDDEGTNLPETSTRVAALTPYKKIVLFAQNYPVGTANVTGVSLNLQDKISVQFKIQPNENLSYAELRVQNPDGSFEAPVTVALDKNDPKVYRASEDRFVAAYSEITTKMISQGIKLTIYDKDGYPMDIYRTTNEKTYTKDDPLVYSAADWCNAAIDKYGADKSNKTAWLAMSVLNLGGEAQKYFDNYNPEHPANPKAYLADDMASFTKNSSLDLYMSDANAKEKGYSAMSLELASDTRLRVKFTVNTEVAVDGYKKALVPEGSRYILDITGLRCIDLDQRFSVEFKATDGSSITLRICALSWCNAAIDKLGSNPNDQTVRLAKAVYLYSMAAENYFF